MRRVVGLVVIVASMAMTGSARLAGPLPSPDTVAGYIAMLLVNETPFPGERGWESEDDTKGAMLAILWVLECRLHHIPEGYKQEHIASERCKTIIDVITAGGEHGQCDGFYRLDSGEFVSVPRVQERIDYLIQCAQRGPPGRFARLLDYAALLATAYVEGGMEEADRFAALEMVGAERVTGRAYSWMTDSDCYSPGGNFVRISDSENGSMGGNRFFTLRKLQ